MWNLVSIRLEIVLVLVQDRCTVCAKRTTGTEIILDTPGGTLGGVGQVEAHFSPFGDSLNLGARYVCDLRQTHHRLRIHFACT